MQFACILGPNITHILRHTILHTVVVLVLECVSCCYAVCLCPWAKNYAYFKTHYITYCSCVFSSLSFSFCLWIQLINLAHSKVSWYCTANTKRKKSHNLRRLLSSYGLMIGLIRGQSWVLKVTTCISSHQHLWHLLMYQQNPEPSDNCILN